MLSNIAYKMYTYTHFYIQLICKHSKEMNTPNSENTTRSPKLEKQSNQKNRKNEKIFRKL